MFKLDRARKETVLYSFTGGPDGANPSIGLVPDQEGNFYGATGYGGDLASTQPSCFGIGCGVVFKLKLRGEGDEDSAGASPTGATQNDAVPANPRAAAVNPANGVPAGRWGRSRGGPWYRIPGSGTGPEN